MDGDAATGVLDVLDPQRLEREALLDDLESLQRSRAVIEACEQRVLARLDAWRPTNFDEREPAHARWRRDGFLREEVAAILRCAPSTAAGRMAEAAFVAEQLPAALAATGEAVLTGGQLRALAEAALGLDPAVRGELESRMLTAAERSGSGSAAEFRARCRRQVARLDPAGAQRRHEHAHRDRRVEFRPGEDGMGAVWALLAADQLARARQHLNARADALRHGDPDDQRTRDQLRADILADLLTGTTDQTRDTMHEGGGDRAAGGGPRPIEVTVAFSTLLRLDELPGSIDGEPVPASLARLLAFDSAAWWRPVLIDRGGYLEAIGARRYRPSALLGRLVRLHDGTCRFPGCRRRAVACDLDHADPFNRDDPTAGGLTVFGNLHSLCRRHHRLKHEAGWQVVRDQSTTIWTSPAGRTYYSDPEPWLDPPPDPGSVGQGNPPDDPPPY